MQERVAGLERSSYGERVAPGGVGSSRGARRTIGPGWSCPRPKVSVLSSILSSPQRSFTLAIAATIVCLPLLVLDLVWASGSSDGPVAAVEAESTVPVSSAPVTVAEVVATVPPTTAAPTTTVARPSVAPATARSTPPTTVARRVTPTTVAPPPPPPPIVSGSDAAFLACVRARESGGNYGIVDGSGNYMGAYQFAQSTWDSVASRAGRRDLVGVRPNLASPADQDAIALATLAIAGRSPWGGACG